MEFSMSVDQKTRSIIHDQLCRFFLAFDEKGWDSMEALLDDQVSIDYASSGREPPSVMSGADFVARRRGAVDELSKQHSFSNLLITSTTDGLKARCNYLILRFSKYPPSIGEDFYHSCGSYTFGFEGSAGTWKISSITQRMLRSWGNRDLHTGSKKS